MLFVPSGCVPPKGMNVLDPMSLWVGMWNGWNSGIPYTQCVWIITSNEQWWQRMGCIRLLKQWNMLNTGTVFKISTCGLWASDGKFCIIGIMTEDVGDFLWEKQPCFLREWDLAVWAYNLHSIQCYMEPFICAKTVRRCFWNHESIYCTCSITCIKIYLKIFRLVWCS